MSNIYGGGGRFWLIWCLPSLMPVSSRPPADEVNSLVLDMGSCLFKAGYGGDDMPKALFPSVSWDLMPCTQLSDHLDVLHFVFYTSQSFGYLPNGDASSSAMEVDGAPRDQNGKNYLIGNSAVNVRKDNMEIRSAFNTEGLISDWEAAEQLWGHAFK